jgi:hypothetical protein
MPLAMSILCHLETREDQDESPGQGKERNRDDY